MVLIPHLHIYNNVREEIGERVNISMSIGVKILFDDRIGPHVSLNK